MPTQEQLRRGPGRPPTGKLQRSCQVCFYLTEEDAEKLDEIAGELQFRSRSTMMAAIMERLISGGFSGITFAKLGWQFAGLLEKCPQSRFDFKSAAKPLPPLIYGESDPTGAAIVPFLEGIKKEARKEKSV